MIIGERIKKAREQMKLSQKEVAERLEMDASQYSKIEKGKVMPTLLQIIEISNIVEKSLDYLVTGNMREHIVKSDDYKEMLDLAKQNISLLNQMMELKDQIEALKLENTNLKTKRSASQTAYTMVAEPEPELTKKNK